MRLHIHNSYNNWQIYGDMSSPKVPRQSFEDNYYYYHYLGLVFTESRQKESSWAIGKPVKGFAI